MKGLSIKYNDSEERKTFCCLFESLRLLEFESKLLSVDHNFDLWKEWMKIQHFQYEPNLYFDLKQSNFPGRKYKISMELKMHCLFCE